MATIPNPIVQTAVQAANPYGVIGGKTQWELIPIGGIADYKQRKLAVRLNAFGSLFYFISFILGRTRLKAHLHGDWCRIVEKEVLQEVIELPRDHFKSTIFSEGAPIWWALPFGDADAYAMERLGYAPEFIRWMRYCHNQDTRTLIVSEVIINAVKIGKRIGHHYENNVLFKEIFPEVLPDSKCTWTEKTMQQRRTKASPDGEGTFDLIGVGAALQSRHYNRIIEDDLVGKEAIDSQVTMESSIDYHRLLPGAFDSDPTLANRMNDEIIVGNRWSCKDLNNWVRENEPWFNFTSHSATGGCCSKHPVGRVIFPEEWSIEKLNKVKLREGIYHYSCQYENNPIPEGQNEFKPDWLNYYETAPISANDNRMKFVHMTKNGVALPDIHPADLQIELLADPRHSDNENEGRCRHGIVVLGYLYNPQRIYLIDQWAEHCGYDAFVAKIYELAKRYKLSNIWLETICAQKLLKLYLDYRNRIEGRRLRIDEFKRDTSANAKLNRIRSMNVYYADGQFFLRQCHSEWFTEYSTFPYGKTVDLLDVTGYAPQTFQGRSTPQEIISFMRKQRERFDNAQRSVTGY
jgi:hypothetical protein